MGVSVDLSVGVRGRFRGQVPGVFPRTSLGVFPWACSWVIAVGASVDVSVGDRGVAVSAAVEIAAEIAVSWILEAPPRLRTLSWCHDLSPSVLPQ